MRVADFSPILGAVASMLVWAAHFLLVYGTQATACARRLAGARLLGLLLIPSLVLGLTLSALAVIAVIGLCARHRLRGGLSGEEGEDEPQFTLWVAATISLLSALAVVWEAVPVLVLPACG